VRRRFRAGAPAVGLMGSVPPECSWRSDRLPPAHTVRRVVVRASSIPPRSDETSMRRGSGCTAAGGGRKGLLEPLATEVPIAPWWPRGLMQPNREPELIVAPPEKGNDSGQRMDSSPPPATPSIQEQVKHKYKYKYPTAGKDYTGATLEKKPFNTDMRQSENAREARAARLRAKRAAWREAPPTNRF